ncbi:histidine ammonia-lyase [Marinobacter nauticus]|uniref:Histidine ammonia-lyase n=1 Tax=Marinobacter nauticus TaxID=2743 RepID=A0A368Y5D1_MARNT|nr:aromatic amino acid ammonia-lyase [Marinobacter nauticus]RCW75402.1 histidine ammonia-lyase [Marinobacter nauticus]
MTGKCVELTPAGLSLNQLEAVAAGLPLRLSEVVERNIESSHDRLSRYLQENRRIYGVTTGYGPLADTLVGSDYSEALQRNLIAHLSAGVGAPLSRLHTRATMASRISTLARGHSGISPAAFHSLLQCLNRDAVPVVPSMGTVGASGDLTPLAHIGAALMGQGEMCLAGGEPNRSDEVLRSIGIMPFEPSGKDALALVNGTSAMTGIAGLNGKGADRALRWSTLLCAGHAEVLDGRLEAWHPAFGEVRPHPGQQRLHRWLNLLAKPTDRRSEDSHTVSPGEVIRLDSAIQDPYSLRCAPQLLGAVSDQVDWHNQTVHIELNSVTDNPILPDDLDGVLHGGNFYGQHVAFASDALANAVITMAVHAERRIARVCNPRLNKGLPAFLQSDKTGLQSGFMGAQVTASALLAEMRTKATPASIQSIPTNGDNQDVVTMGTIGARRTADLLELLNNLLAIDALMVAQAIDLRSQQHSDNAPGSAVAELLAWVRLKVPRLTNDRPLNRDIAEIARSIQLPSNLTDKKLEWLFV